jgi:exportin-1
MTQAKTKALKASLCQEFSEVFQLCHEILENADKPSLINATLHTLLRFLNWIPLGYIFETNLIDILCNRVPRFHIVLSSPSVPECSSQVFDGDRILTGWT